MRLNRPLSAYVQALWGQDIALLPPVPGQGNSPCLTELGIHLPRQPAARNFQYAAAAHASAHRRFPRLRLPWIGRTGITRVLISLLEDARVEALALRELPGLLRLWLPFHAEIAAEGADFPSLLARLARALLDADYHDEHAWIRKGRQLFATAGGADAAPAELDRIASLLGHDIGQLRLQFNHREYVLQPGYRDDQRWLWEPESNSETALEMGSATSSSDTEATAHNTGQATVLPPLLTRHPEWDHRIRRLRPQWCLVRSWTPIAAAVAVNTDRQASAGLIQRFRQRARWRQPRDSHHHTGETFATNRLIDAGIAQRLRQLPDDNIQLRSRWLRPSLALVLLLDASASTRQASGTSGPTFLEMACVATTELTLAGEAAGCAVAVHAFRSAGREAVDYLLLREPHEPWDARIDQRLNSLTSAGSTRLGAALRQATAWLAQRSEPDRRIVVLTDGQPHDLDIHDPLYLTADARHAVTQARAAGVCMNAIGLGEDSAVALRRIFGVGRWTLLGQLSNLPACMKTILNS
jgi:nitric oxide reductase NorD protein